MEERQELLRVDHLKKYFQTPGGLLHAVDDVSFSIRRGETLGVVGESGCGKSTLGRAILRLHEPTSGEIYFKGENIRNRSREKMKELRRNMQIIFQDPFASLNPRMTVSQAIAEPLLIQKIYTDRDKAQIARLVREMMDLVAIAQSSPGAIAVNASISIGYRCAGILGAVVAVIGTVLPPLVILTVISYCYEAFIKIQWIQIMLFGMQAGVVATICDVVWTMGKEVWSQPQKVYVLIMLVAFVCNVLFDVNLLIIIVVCGALGYMIERAMKKEGGLQ